MPTAAEMMWFPIIERTTCTIPQTTLAGFHYTFIRLTFCTPWMNIDRTLATYQNSKLTQVIWKGETQRQAANSSLRCQQVHNLVQDKRHGPLPMNRKYVTLIVKNQSLIACTVNMSTSMATLSKPVKMQGWAIGWLEEAASPPERLSRLSCLSPADYNWLQLTTANYSWLHMTATSNGLLIAHHTEVQLTALTESIFFTSHTAKASPS